MQIVSSETICMECQNLFTMKKKKKKKNIISWSSVELVQRVAKIKLNQRK